jgi:hypothetical protein
MRTHTPLVLGCGMSFKSLVIGGSVLGRLNERFLRRGRTYDGWAQVLSAPSGQGTWKEIQNHSQWLEQSLPGYTTGIFGHDRLLRRSLVRAAAVHCGRCPLSPRHVGKVLSLNGTFRPKPTAQVSFPVRDLC